jgi:diguanylate cyclase (GGDEF)-like protein/PAS domain S-box-containing protein
MINLQILKTAFMNSRESITIADLSLPDIPLIFVNPAFEEMTGYFLDEIVGQNCRHLQLTDVGQKDELNTIREAIKNNKSCLVTLRNYRKDGSMFWNELSLSPILNDAGEPSYYLGIQKNVSDKVLIQKAIIKKNDELAFQKFALDEHAIVYIANMDGVITYANDKFCAISGYVREELLGINIDILRSDEHSNAFFVDIRKTISSGHTWHGEIKNTTKMGSHYWVKSTLVPTLNDKGKPYQYLGIHSEITQRKRTEASLKWIAHDHVLTGLPNRASVEERLSHLTLNSQWPNRLLAVAYLDLDDFKSVNDTFGYKLGDELLVTLSKRMSDVLSKNDTLGRIGGDEFIIIIADLEKTEDCEPILKRLLEVIAEPVTLGDAVVNISASIGVSFNPLDAVDVDPLIRQASQAMWDAKQSGKNCYRQFDTAQDNATKVQRQLIDDVGAALINNEFVMHYQPKVNMRTSEVIGVEALIRWQHPERGIIPPLDFLPAIEGHAISLELGEWVIHKALNQISQWQSLRINLPISVNISAYQLTQKNFPDRLSILLAAHPLVSPHRLELEILETSALSDLSQVSGIMKTCQDMGVSFALDDFGTGYSSLTYLRRLPAYMIKIDQSFVRNMLEDEDDLAIVEGVIALTKSFKLDVIAEGVESIEHGTALLRLGCELAQGYGIARPMPASDIPEWASSWQADDSWRSVDH